MLWAAVRPCSTAAFSYSTRTGRPCTTLWYSHKSPAQKHRRMRAAQELVAPHAAGAPELQTRAARERASGSAPMPAITASASRLRPRSVHGADAP